MEASLVNVFEQLKQANNKLDSMQLQIALIQKKQSTKVIDDVEDLILIDQAVKEFNLTKPTIYRRRMDNSIPYMKRGNRLYFSRKALLQWIQETQKDPIAA